MLIKMNPQTNPRNLKQAKTKISHAYHSNIKEEQFGYNKFLSNDSLTGKKDKEKIDEGNNVESKNLYQTDYKFKDHFFTKVNFVDKDKYNERIKNIESNNSNLLTSTNNNNNYNTNTNNILNSNKDKEREEINYNKNDSYTIFFDKINEIRKEYFARYKTCEAKIGEVESINKKLFELLISQIKNFIPLNMDAFDKLLPPSPLKAPVNEKKKEQIEAPVTKIDGTKIINFVNKEVPKNQNFYMNMLETNYKSNDNYKKNFQNPKKFLVIDTTKKNYTSNNEGDNNQRCKKIFMKF